MERAGYYTPEEDRYKPYEGTTIVVSWPALSHFEKAKELIPQFEEETGITVEVDSIQYETMHDKQVLEMSKPEGGDYDLVLVGTRNSTGCNVFYGLFLAGAFAVIALAALFRVLPPLALLALLA